MPHTPLLTRLHTLAGDHLLADAHGVGVPEARRYLSRRTFIKTGLKAGAAGLALAGGAPRSAGAADTRTIAIVGGGIAGMTAALMLADAGFASTVYEATGRIGGRMASNRTYWDDGQVSEGAGELIDTSHKTMRALVKRFNLALDDLIVAEAPRAEETYYFNGQRYDDADRDFQAVHVALQADVNAAGYPTTWDSSTPAGRALDNMSVAQWIDSRVPGGRGSRLGALLDVAYNIEYGAETTDQSALNLVYLLGYGTRPGRLALFGASNERYHIRGGNDQLPAAIAASLPSGAVRTGWRMTKVATQADSKVALTFDVSGTPRTVVVDHAILTLPFTVLRSLDYGDAGFDARKARAITELGGGRNGKLQLQFTGRPWVAQGSTGATYADTGYQASWEVTRGQAGASGILNDYTGGDVTGAMASRNPSITFANASNPGVVSEARRFLSLVEPVFPGVSAQWNGKATLSLPHRSPDLRCSYSYWRVGQYQAFAGYEGAPQGHVYFAGEHTSLDAQGYMEGGAASGLRAANEVIRALTGK